MTRRELLKSAGALAVSSAIPLRLRPGAPSIRLAVITDLHYGFAPDALDRLRAFADACGARPKADAVLQLGDFCHADGTSGPCLDLFAKLAGPKFHVLGNHDMDKCDKAAAMRAWGMPSRYGSRVVGGYRLIWLDLNNLRKEGEVRPYANGNYFGAGQALNLCDAEQLAWLTRELQSYREPVILLSHQPLGIGTPGQPLPAEQLEVLEVVRESRERNPKGAVVLCLSGHLHVDRLESWEGIPCLCVNSASYFWHDGMNAYRRPLFAFLTIGSDGVLRVEGAEGEFIKPPPSGSDSVVGRSAGISNRSVPLKLG